MNYRDLRTQFKNILNRNDCSDEQADTFISMGLRRIERILRVRFQKKYEDFSGLNGHALPDDLIAISEVTIKGEYINRVTRANKNVEEGYYTNAGQIRFTDGIAQSASSFRLIYYSGFPKSLADDEEAVFTTDLLDVTIYAALVFASDTFVDDRKSNFERTMGQLATEIQTSSDIQEMSGGLVIGAYGGGIA